MAFLVVSIAVFFLSFLNQVACICHFTDEETEVQKREVTYSRAYSELRAESAPDPKFLDMKCLCSVLRVV